MAQFSLFHNLAWDKQVVIMVISHGMDSYLLIGQPGELENLTSLSTLEKRSQLK